MTPDTIAIIATVILAAVGVVAIRKSDNAEIHADLRELRGEVSGIKSQISDLRGDISELRGALLAHITGHSHLPKIAAADSEAD